MRINAIRTIGGAILLAVTVMTLPARAQNVYAYLYDPARVTTDDQLFLNLAVRDAGLTRTMLDPLLPRVRSLDSDLPVILFIARQTGRPVDAIVALRAQGASWADVFRQLGIRYDTLFTGIDRDPGPYYRSTWSYWTAHRDRPQFTDVQIGELARLQLAQRIAGVPIYEVARVRNPVVVVADRRGRPWTARAVGVPPGHGGVPPGHGGVPPGQVKNGVPPGHRDVVNVENAGKVKVKEKGHDRDDGDHRDHGDKGKARGQGQGKGKGKGHGKH
jgi:hypothetical protein